jgi:hypothetical protein
METKYYIPKHLGLLYSKQILPSDDEIYLLDKKEDKMMPVQGQLYVCKNDSINEDIVPFKSNYIPEYLWPQKINNRFYAFIFYLYNQYERIYYGITRQHNGNYLLEALDADDVSKNTNDVLGINVDKIEFYRENGEFYILLVKGTYTDLYLQIDIKVNDNTNKIDLVTKTKGLDLKVSGLNDTNKLYSIKDVLSGLFPKLPITFFNNINKILFSKFITELMSPQGYCNNIQIDYVDIRQKIIRIKNYDISSIAASNLYTTLRVNRVEDIPYLEEMGKFYNTKALSRYVEWCYFQIKSFV